MDEHQIADDLARVLISEDEIQQRLTELADEIEADYDGEDLLLVGVLKGAVMVMADLARALDRHVEMDWMAVSSYGSGTTSSGVVRILKDLDTDITGRHVLIVEDIIDTGLTLSWLVANLVARAGVGRDLHAAAQAGRAQGDRRVGTSASTSRTSSWSGYGLDYAERYRNLRSVGTLAPHVYS